MALLPESEQKSFLPTSYKAGEKKDYLDCPLVFAYENNIAVFLIMSIFFTKNIKITILDIIGLDIPFQL